MSEKPVNESTSNLLENDSLKKETKTIPVQEDIKEEVINLNEPSKEDVNFFEEVQKRKLSVFIAVLIIILLLVTTGIVLYFWFRP